jgi:hypothetical protein
MAKIDDAQLKSLQQLFADVAFRANRLAEWMELDLISRPLGRSIERLCDETVRNLRQIQSNPPQGAFDAGLWQRIVEFWNSCKDEDIQSLRNFRIQYINQQLSASSPNVDTWIAELTNRAAAIQKDIDNITAVPLEQKVREFRDFLKQQTHTNRSCVALEIKQLTTLSFQLQAKLENITHNSAPSNQP